MGRADKTTLPQQSNRQDIAKRPKETLQADHTDQNRSSSTGFWYLPHLFQFLQAPAATDSWAALIVGEHIYFERLVGSFESPSNTFFFFPVSLIWTQFTTSLFDPLSVIYILLLNLFKMVLNSHC